MNKICINVIRNQDFDHKTQSQNYMIKGVQYNPDNLACKFETLL